MRHPTLGLRLLLVLVVLTLALPGQAGAHKAEGTIARSGDCGAGMFHSHNSYSIDAGTMHAGFASSGCRDMRVSVVWYTGSYYSSCKKQSYSNQSVTVSTRDTACKGTGPVQRFTKSRHQLKTKTWGKICDLFHGKGRDCL
jgi:hypothetical protein